MKKEPKKYQYALCHIDLKLYPTINKELKEKGYKHIKAIIPTISILRKRSKGKDIYENVPILFSYGFIKMPSEKAFSRRFLNKLKKDIIGIISWVKSTETMHPKKLKKRVDNSEDWDDFSIVSIASYEEVRRIRRLAKKNKVYSRDEIVSLKPGSYIVLKGYPYDGCNASVIEVNLKSQTVKLMLYPENGQIMVTLPFQNCIYSIYHNFDENKLECPLLDFKQTQICQEDIDGIMEYKQW